MATFQSTVLTLYRRDLGEADHLVVFLSPERGRFRAKSRGTQRPGSKLAAAIQPFVLSQALLAEGRSLATLCQAEVLESFRPLREDLARWAHASYLAELVDRGLPEGQPAEAAFRLVTDCFRAMETSDDPACPMSQFEVKFMAELGLNMGLTRCMTCHAAVGEKGGFWSPGQGGVLCRSCGRGRRGASPISGEVILTLRKLERAPFGEQFEGDLSPGGWGELRQVVHEFVQYHMEWEFKTLQFLRSLMTAPPHATPVAGSTAGPLGGERRAVNDG